MTANTYHHGDLREALIHASHKILNEKGADALSLRAIAAEVGVSHMAPYSHFKSKKSLFQEVAASGFDALADKMKQASQTVQSPAERILSYGVSYIEFALAQPQLYRLMLGQVENAGRRGFSKTASTDQPAPLSFSAQLQGSSKRPFELLENAFTELNNKGDKLTVKAQALGAWSMVHGMAALLIEGHFEIPPGMSIKDFLALAAFYKPGTL